LFYFLQMSQGERNRLLAEIEQNRAQVAAMRSEVQWKTTEMNKLKDEVNGGGNANHRRGHHHHHHLHSEFNGDGGEPAGDDDDLMTIGHAGE
jgi:hypothetical protein